MDINEKAKITLAMVEIVANLYGICGDIEDRCIVPGVNTTRVVIPNQDIALYDSVKVGEPPTSYLDVRVVELKKYRYTIPELIQWDIRLGTDDVERVAYYHGHVDKS